MSATSKTASTGFLVRENRTFPPSAEVIGRSYIDAEHYQRMYERSINDPEGFWLDQAATLDWIRRPTIARKFNWNTNARVVRHTWFEDGQLNATVNCLDRQLMAGRGDQAALLFQGDADHDVIRLTYAQLHSEVCKVSNALKSLGVRKGDRVCIYLPMILELPIAMLACARIGAIHSVVFGGYSAGALTGRVNDSGCRLLITANCGRRGGKLILLKGTADEALNQCPRVTNVVVVRRDETACNMVPGRDLWWHDLTAQANADCAPEVMNAEDPLFILYTSGSTGKPKGVVHTTAGYLLHVALTTKYVFDIHEEDLFWCTADIGWVPGHSYLLYGPLANGFTSLVFEGVPTYPDAGRFWRIVEKFRVTQFYTAPSAIRSLIRLGDEWPDKYDLSSLRVLGTVGEPINPEAWLWYYRVIGKERCPIVDTWWQTETGGHLITPLPGAHPLKPGSAGRPFFGVEPVVLRDDGSECAPNEGGKLCIKKPWPGMMRTTWGDHERFIDTYFTMSKNVYYTGDACRTDLEGDFWLMGRIEDVPLIPGLRIGTAEVESALLRHPNVAEAAVAAMPHGVKSPALCAFVKLRDGVAPSEELRSELIMHVRKEIGPIATPDKIQFAAALPKTRSGKIMRSILRKFAENQVDQFGAPVTLKISDETGS